MKMQYDKHVDALSIDFVDRPRSARTEEVGEGITLDYDTKGKLVALEILNASRLAPAASLGKLPRTSNWLTLAEAAKESKLGISVLRRSIDARRLKARRAGRGWKVELADLYNYLESRGR